MDNNYSGNNGTHDDSAAELNRMETLLNDASASIDNGKFDDAINDFNQVIDITHSVFGNSPELTEVRRKIQEVQQQLEEIRRSGK